MSRLSALALAFAVSFGVLASSATARVAGLSNRLGNPGADAILRVPGDFSTIQDAIETSELGDVIFVAPGTYVETLDMAHAVTLVSRGAVVIAADPELSALTIHDTGLDPVNVVGFEFVSPPRKNSALTVERSKDVWLESLVLECTAGYFSALAVLDGSFVHAEDIQANGAGNDVTSSNSVVGLSNFNRCE